MLDSTYQMIPRLHWNLISAIKRYNYVRNVVGDVKTFPENL